MDQNCYLIYDDNNVGAIIDPGLDTFKILKTIEDKKVDVKYILLTHAHYDHTFSVNELRGHKIIIGTKECSDNIKNTGYNLSEFACKPFKIDGVDKEIADGEIFNVGDIKITAIKTPGHSNCSVCYLIGDNLFSGDTLFLRSVGRCDLPTGNFNELENSIKTKLYTLPDETKVYPGHGADTSIGYEKKYNMYIN